VSWRTRIQFEPLADWQFPKAQRREYSKFSASYAATLHDLGRELDALGAYRHGGAAVQVVTTGGSIRRDGLLRANTTIEHPGVALSFLSDHGPLTFHCDRYNVRSVGRQGAAWQHNLRAIVLTLEALRAVDRYGATQTGEQYTGFLAIANPTVTQSAARARLGEIGEVKADEELGDRLLVRKAREKSHPDRHSGNEHLWHEVEVLARALGVTK
jgi:hypothetical protein